MLRGACASTICSARFRKRQQLWHAHCCSHCLRSKNVSSAEGALLQCKRNSVSNGSLQRAHAVTSPPVTSAHAAVRSVPLDGRSAAASLSSAADAGASTPQGKVQLVPLVAVASPSVRVARRSAQAHCSTGTAKRSLALELTAHVTDTPRNAARSTRPLESGPAMCNSLQRTPGAVSRARSPSRAVSGTLVSSGLTRASQPASSHHAVAQTVPRSAVTRADIKSGLTAVGRAFAAVAEQRCGPPALPASQLSQPAIDPPCTKQRADPAVTDLRAIEAEQARVAKVQRLEGATHVIVPAGSSVVISTTMDGAPAAPAAPLVAHTGFDSTHQASVRAAWPRPPAQLSAHMEQPSHAPSIHCNVQPPLGLQATRCHLTTPLGSEVVAQRTVASGPTPASAPQVGDDGHDAASGGTARYDMYTQTPRRGQRRKRKRAVENSLVASNTAWSQQAYCAVHNASPAAIQQQAFRSKPQRSSSKSSGCGSGASDTDSQTAPLEAATACERAAAAPSYMASSPALQQQSLRWRLVRPLQQAREVKCPDATMDGAQHVLQGSNAMHCHARPQPAPLAPPCSLRGALGLSPPRPLGALPLFWQAGGRPGLADAAYAGGYTPKQLAYAPPSLVAALRASSAHSAYGHSLQYRCDSV